MLFDFKTKLPACFRIYRGPKLSVHSCICDVMQHTATHNESCCSHYFSVGDVSRSGEYMWRDATHCNTQWVVLQTQAVCWSHVYIWWWYVTWCNTMQHRMGSVAVNSFLLVTCPDMMIICDLNRYLSMQLTATHCNTLPHTATHSNTQWIMLQSSPISLRRVQIWWSHVTRRTQTWRDVLCTWRNSMLHACADMRAPCHMWMSHVTYAWVMSHMSTRICDMTHSRESRHVRESRTSRTWVTSRRESRHVWMSHVTYECVEGFTSHMSESRCDTQNGSFTCDMTHSRDSFTCDVTHPRVTWLTWWFDVDSKGFKYEWDTIRLTCV